MSETNGSHWDEPPDEPGPEEPRGPYRVIGTPPPARTLLGEAEHISTEPAVRELPAGPDDEKKAKGAERTVAALFLLSLVASIAFIVAYVALGFCWYGNYSIVKFNLKPPAHSELVGPNSPALSNSEHLTVSRLHS